MIFDGRFCRRRRRDGIWQLHMRQHHNAFLWANAKSMGLLGQWAISHTFQCIFRYPRTLTDIGTLNPKSWNRVLGSRNLVPFWDIMEGMGHMWHVGYRCNRLDWQITDLNFNWNSDQACTCAVGYVQAYACAVDFDATNGCAVDFHEDYACAEGILWV